MRQGLAHAARLTCRRGSLEERKNGSRKKVGGGCRSPSPHAQEVRELEDRRGCRSPLPHAQEVRELEDRRGCRSPPTIGPKPKKLPFFRPSSSSRRCGTARDQHEGAKTQSFEVGTAQPQNLRVFVPSCSNGGRTGDRAWVPSASGRVELQRIAHLHFAALRVREAHR